jgi:hypothetical protein
MKPRPATFSPGFHVPAHSHMPGRLPYLTRVQLARFGDVPFESGADFMLGPFHARAWGRARPRPDPQPMSVRRGLSDPHTNGLRGQKMKRSRSTGLKAFPCAPAQSRRLRWSYTKCSPTRSSALSSSSKVTRPSVGLEVSHLGDIHRRDDEAEMMPDSGQPVNRLKVTDPVVVFQPEDRATFSLKADISRGRPWSARRSPCCRDWRAGRTARGVHALISSTPGAQTVQ